MTFLDLIAAANIEFQLNVKELASQSREKRLVDIRSILALAVQKVPGLYYKSSHVI
jgi:hypothetical protein